MEEIVVISGKATHGKDETAKRIISALEKEGKTCLIIAVGDALKSTAGKYFGWDGQKDEKGRTILQSMAMLTRKNNPGVWSNILNELIKALGPEYDYVFVPDVRFPIEAESLKKAFPGKVRSIFIKRINYESTLTMEQQKNITENSMDGYPFNDIIINDTLEELELTCQRLAKRILKNEL